eukprot:352158-Chlamydomonas_euryale.AAC.4
MDWMWTLSPFSKGNAPPADSALDTLLEGPLDTLLEPTGFIADATTAPPPGCPLFNILGAPSSPTPVSAPPKCAIFVNARLCTSKCCAASCFLRRRAAATRACLPTHGRGRRPSTRRCALPPTSLPKATPPPWRTSRPTSARRSQQPAGRSIMWRCAEAAASAAATAPHPPHRPAPTRASTPHHTYIHLLPKLPAHHARHAASLISRSQVALTLVCTGLLRRLFCLQLVDACSLSPVEDASKQATLLAVAAHFDARDTGTVRLIDNIVIGE